MARAAVKAKQREAAAKAAPARARKKRSRGGPNDQLFFMRLRTHAKVAYVILAVLFAVTFAFLGVGSGSSGLQDLFRNINLFGGGGNGTPSISKAQDEVTKHPGEAKGYADLADAYIAKGNTDQAIFALQQYTSLKPKDAKQLARLAGLEMTQAQTLQNQYYSAANEQYNAAPSQTFAPASTTALGKALGSNPIEQAVATQASTRASDLYSRSSTSFSQAVGTYEQLARVRKNDPDIQFQLGQAAQQANQPTVAIAAYRRYLALSPDSTNTAQIKQLIKQLQAQLPKGQRGSGSSG